MSKGRISKLLIANRGEIACRIMASARQLGIATVAVYSDADAQAQHVRQADCAYRIGPARPNESYLNIEAILTAAKASGADAIHPGYGFLSENPGFVRACEENGLTFVGPSASTMEAVGSKATAKATMEQAGVPTVPGYHGHAQDEKTLVAEAKRVGFPLMIKAAAGGGGKGMRIVRTTADFKSALAAARREAANAFGDEQVILERYLNQPRHIEVQVFGDQHGSVVHLFERDCSSQRRYQKVIEESPAPGIDERTRQALCQAAVRAAQAVDYINAGTVEFIVDTDGEFFFMEMNARLQVEHPVTEAVTGLDLVAWQLQIANGRALPLEQAQIRRHGHAFEARIYAEDPARGFLPASGRIQALQWPPQARLDTGVVGGDEITVHYDPMIAKLVVHGEDREQALGHLRQALQQTLIVGLGSNLDFLLALCHDPHLVEGRMHTAYLDQALEQLLPPAEPNPLTLLSAAASHLMWQEQAAESRQRAQADPHAPWARADGWRLGHDGRRVISLRYGETRYDIDATGYAGDYRIQIGDKSFEVRHALQDGPYLGLTINGLRQRCLVVAEAPYYQVSSEGRLFTLTAADPFAYQASDDQADNRLTAPMPGRVVAVKCTRGDAVEQGQELLIMEAMKMELSLTAPMAGTVTVVKVAAEDFVEADVLLVEIDPAPSAD